MAFRFDYDSSELHRNVNLLPDKLGALLSMYAVTKASKIESDMKAERPWRDRTNAAKNHLSASVSRDTNDVIRITLAHGVDYGIWLETANEKKYAIISPTINKESPRVIEDMKNMLERIRL